MSLRPTINLADVVVQGGHVIFRDSDWAGYERFAAYFQKLGYGQVAYCNGTLEIMGNESNPHEIVSRILEHLICIYASLLGKRMVSSGSALVGSQEKDAGKNPDESFWFDREPAPGEGPDLVVEVVVTTEAISKQTFYAKFNVPEIWIWEEGKLAVHHLTAEGDGYEIAANSRTFPDLDMKLVERCSNLDFVTDADREFRKGLEKK